MRAAELDRNNIKSGFYFLSGSDTFWRGYAEGIFKSLVSPDSFSLTVIDKLYDINDALFAFGAMSFSAEPNVVIVRDTECKLDDRAHKSLLAVMNGETGGNYLVFSDVAFLNTQEKKLVTVIDCERQDKYSCQKQVERMFVGGIETGAAALLVEYTACDMARIMLEREKLEIFAEGRRITRDDVENVAIEETDLQVFEFVNSIVNGKTDRAVKQLNRLKKRGEAPDYLLAALTGQFRRMLYGAISPLGDKELADIMKVKPFAITKAREVRGYSKLKLKNIVGMLVDYEHKFKSGELSVQAAFDSATAKLISLEVI